MLHYFLSSVLVVVKLDRLTRRVADLDTRTRALFWAKIYFNVSFRGDAPLTKSDREEIDRNSMQGCKLPHLYSH